jgi:hypothetical protein
MKIKDKTIYKMLEWVANLSLDLRFCAKGWQPKPPEPRSFTIIVVSRWVFTIVFFYFDNLAVKSEEKEFTVSRVANLFLDLGFSAKGWQPKPC